MNNELTPEENQVVNLIIIGCQSERTIAHVLDTSVADIEDRLLSIQAKWKATSFEEILERAVEHGYATTLPATASRRITLEDLAFYIKFLGDPSLPAITGTREEKEKGIKVPWKDIQWGLEMANLAISEQIGERAREGYQRMIRRLCKDQTVCDELIIMANKNQFTFRAN